MYEVYVHLAAYIAIFSSILTHMYVHPCVLLLPSGMPCSFTMQTPSETVAKHVALQAGVEGSDLLMGGLTHTVTSARWCPAGRSRVMSTWEVCTYMYIRTLVHVAYVWQHSSRYP